MVTLCCSDDSNEEMLQRKKILTRAISVLWKLFVSTDYAKFCETKSQKSCHGNLSKGLFPKIWYYVTNVVILLEFILLCWEL